LARPLLVHAAELLRRPGSERDVTLDAVPDDVELVDERLVPGSTVGVALHLESLSDGIVVRGSVSVSWQGLCRRCLKPVHGDEVSEVHELYQVKLTDPDAFAVVGDQLDLGAMVREHALLILPASPLCRPDCAGLCLHCGIDRNESSCSCAVESRDDRWAALDALRGAPESNDLDEKWSSGD
jgi:uncharacterized protein